jgi:hypothetical protein
MALRVFQLLVILICFVGEAVAQEAIHSSALQGRISIANTTVPGPIDIFLTGARIYEVKAELDGRYSFSGLPSGTYIMTVFDPECELSITSIDLKSGSTATKDIILRIPLLFSGSQVGSSTSLPPPPHVVTNKNADRLFLTKWLNSADPFVDWLNSNSRFPYDSLEVNSLTSVVPIETGTSLFIFNPGQSLNEPIKILEISESFTPESLTKQLAANASRIYIGVQVVSKSEYLLFLR